VTRRFAMLFVLGRPSRSTPTIYCLIQAFSASWPGLAPAIRDLYLRKRNMNAWGTNSDALYSTYSEHVCCTAT
jgi:hypothetical protein